MNDFEIGAVTLALIIPFLVLIGMAGSEDVKEQERQHSEYCQMVELWHESGGENGWPPYKGECK